MKEWTAFDMAKRTLAACVDYCIVLIAWFMSSFVVAFVAFRDPYARLLFLSLMYMLAIVGYFAPDPTVGQRIFGVHVVDGNGNKPGLSKRFLRGLIIFLSGPIGYLFAFVGPENKALWDIVADTKVVSR